MEMCHFESPLTYRDHHLSVYDLNPAEGQTYIHTTMKTPNWKSVVI
jgi:hypothetical protein